MSKKLLSLFLAVVMLVLAIPAAVLPAVAAGSAPAITTDSWTGTEFTAKNLHKGVDVYDDTAYFFRWYDNGQYLTVKKALISENAVLKINPVLIEKGIVAATDTLDKAFEKWTAYMIENSSVTYTGAWAWGNVNASGVFQKAETETYMNNKSAFYLRTVSSTDSTLCLDTEYDGNHWLASRTVAENQYKDIYRLITAVIQNNPVVSDIALPRDSANMTRNSVPTTNYTGAIRLDDVNTTIRRVQPGDSASKRVGLNWTASKAGCASVNIDSVTYASGSNTTVKFTVLHNGTKLFDEVTIDVNATDAADKMNAAIAAAGEIPVLEGDTVTLVFEQNGSRPYFGVNASAEVDTSRLPVVYKKGDTVLETFVVNAGDPLPALTGVPGFGDVGYIINGEFSKTLPGTVEAGMLIEDYTISTSASMTITTRYIINVYVHADADAIGAGILVSGRYMQGEKQADGSYKVAALHVNAKELQTASVTYQPYQVYEDGYRIATTAKTVTAMELLQAYATGNYDATTKALASGILDFAEALNVFLLNDPRVDLSQTVKNHLKGTYTISGNYFSGKNDIYLATVKYLSMGVVPKYTAPFAGATFVPDSTVTAADKVNMGFADGVDSRDAKYKYALTGANLNYRDQIGFVFRVEANGENSIEDLKAGGSYKLRVDFSPRNYVYYDAFIADGENGKVVIVDGIPASLYGQDMYFTIVEKQADGSYAFVSATMTYSVKAYAVSAYKFSDMSYKSYLAQSIFRLSVLADAYVAAHQ